MNSNEFPKKGFAEPFLMGTGPSKEVGSLPAKFGPNTINTVTGSINTGEMGITLAHEHILSAFGAPPQEPGEYDTKKFAGRSGAPS